MPRVSAQPCVFILEFFDAYLECVNFDAFFAIVVTFLCTRGQYSESSHLPSSPSPLARLASLLPSEPQDQRWQCGYAWGQVDERAIRKVASFSHLSQPLARSCATCGDRKGTAWWIGSRASSLLVLHGGKLCDALRIAASATASLFCTLQPFPSSTESDAVATTTALSEAPPCRHRVRLETQRRWRFRTYCGSCMQSIHPCVNTQWVPPSCRSNSLTNRPMRVVVKSKKLVMPRFSAATGTNRPICRSAGAVLA